MDAHQTPTVTDIAKMLDSIACDDEGHPQTSHVVLWLIERSPPARALYDRLHARRDDRPSLIELARLTVAAGGGGRYPESVYTARWLIERSPAAAKLLARLEQMAADAGLDDEDRRWAMRALAIQEELDRLLATLDDWQDAGEAIELDMEKDYALEFLLSACRARVARARSGERARLERLRRRLQDATAREIRVKDPEAVLSGLESSLRSLADPARTLETIEGLLHHLQEA